MRVALLLLALGCSTGGVPAGDLFAEPEVREVHRFDTRAELW